jgi:hypothetical protein
MVAGWFGSLVSAIHGEFCSGSSERHGDVTLRPYPFGLLTMAVSPRLSCCRSWFCCRRIRSRRATTSVRCRVEVNLTAGLQIAELHSKLDTMNAAMLARLSRIERAATRDLPRAAADS